MTETPVERRYLFDVGDMVGQLRATMRPQIGIAADIVDANVMLGSIIDIAMYGQPLRYRESPTAQLVALRIPTDIAREVVERLCDTVNRLLIVGLGEIDSLKHYEWEIDPLNNDLIITVRNRTLSKAAVPPIYALDPQQAYRDYLKDILDDGGWVSEEQRRSVGL